MEGTGVISSNPPLFGPSPTLTSPHSSLQSVCLIFGWRGHDPAASVSGGLNAVIPLRVLPVLARFEGEYTGLHNFLEKT